MSSQHFSSSTTKCPSCDDRALFTVMQSRIRVPKFRCMMSFLKPGGTLLVFWGFSQGFRSPSMFCHIFQLWMGVLDILQHLKCIRHLGLATEPHIYWRSRFWAVSSLAEGKEPAKCCSFPSLFRGRSGTSFFGMTSGFRSFQKALLSSFLE